MALLSHNEKTLYQLENFTSQSKNCCIVNPCGSGKTSIIAEYVTRNANKKIILFTKQKNAQRYYREKSDVFKNVTIVTYSMMYKDYQSGQSDKYDAEIYIMDEAHYIGANNWSKAFEGLVDRFNPIVVGVTATPQRFEDQGTDETIVSRYFDGNSAGGYTTKQLQKMGVFTEPEYILSLYNLEEEIGDRFDRIGDAELDEEQKRKYQKQLYEIYKEWKKNSCPEVILKEALPRYMYKDNSNRILVYMSSIAEIDDKRDKIDELIQEIFPNRLLKSYRYTHKDRETSLLDFLKEDDNYIKILYSVDKIMETIHIDDLNIILMLRPSVSNRIITQQFGRVNSIGNDKRSLIIDMVGNLQNINAVSFPGGSGVGTGTKKNGSNTSCNINLIHIQKYQGLFAMIDRAFVKTIYYTYEGITDTLYRLCEIFDKDFHTVRTLVKDFGIGIEEAFEQDKSSRKPYVSQETFEGIRNIPEFKLTDEQRECVKAQISTVDRFIKRYSIEDDDLKQDLYLEMMRCISQREHLDINLNASVINHLKYHYTKIRRMAVIKNTLYTKEAIEQLNLVYEDRMADNAAIKEYVTQKLPHELNTLKERERVTLVVRYGLDGGPELTLEEAGKIFNVTRERVRQIEIRGLRLFRHPMRFNYKTDGKELFEAYEKSHETVSLYTNKGIYNLTLPCL